MAKFALPKEGCYHATYPSTAWEEIPCGPPPNIPAVPALVSSVSSVSNVSGGTPKPEAVGCAYGDDMAVSANGALIDWAEGSFPMVSGTSTSDPTNYTLQLNSQKFNYANPSQSKCAGASNPSTCQGWQQFVDWNNLGPYGGVGIQWWLVGYGTCTGTTANTCSAVCPSGWTPSVAYAPQCGSTPPYPYKLSCYQSSGIANFTTQPTTNLANIALTGTAGSTGDMAILSIGGDIYASMQSSMLNLNANWTQAEFNIFGYGNAAQYSFAETVDLVDQVLIDYPGGQIPTCQTGKSTTGESNNLTISSSTCCSWASGAGGMTTGIQFQESQTSSPPNEICKGGTFDPNWSNANDPFDAIVLGTDIGGVPLHACRGTYPVGTFGVTPGETRNDWTYCDIGYGGNEEGISEPYQTLVPAWQDDTNGNVPSNAYRWGTDEGGYPLYVCRAYLNNEGLQIGKVRPGLGACLIPYGGSEVSVSAYEVLTEQNAQPFPMSGTTPTSIACGEGSSCALVGGYDSNGTQPTIQYPCAAYVQGYLTPGKIDATWTACYVGFGNTEYSESNYFV